MPFTPGEKAGAATYARIKEEAVELFATHGFASTALHQVASRLDITTAALYYYFSSKEELLRELVEPILASGDKLLAGFDGKRALTADEKYSLLEGYLSTLLADPRLTRLVSLDLAVRNHPEIGPRIDAQFRRVEELLAGPKPSRADTVLTWAALGTLRRSVLELEGVELDDEVRELLVGAAMGVLESARTRRDGRRSPSPGDPTPATSWPHEASG